jgi:hypothetical protein
MEKLQNLMFGYLRDACHSEQLRKGQLSEDTSLLIMRTLLRICTAVAEYLIRPIWTSPITETLKELLPRPLSVSSSYSLVPCSRKVASHNNLQLAEAAVSAKGVWRTTAASGQNPLIQ